MLIDFFFKLKESKIPVTITEFLFFLEALNRNLIQYDVTKFYYLSRAILVKDERMFDRFDIVFAQYFQSIEEIDNYEFIDKLNIPKDWLENNFKKFFSSEDIKKIKSSKNFNELLKTLKKRLKEQTKRHQGGNKWIGTLGSSPFGAYGYNPMGIRIGQEKSITRKAIKVWDKRDFKDFDDSIELNTRGIQVALKKLRQWARTGINDELDIKETIKSTAKEGYLDIKTRKQRENSIKILIFLDVGGSMDDHVKQIEELFSAARNTFKNLEYFYFHNCLYDYVWKSNSRRWSEKLSTSEIIRTYGSDYKCIFVGDASMSPYEIIYPGAANEYFNEETGKVWLERALIQWPSFLWINPVEKNHWEYFESIQIIKAIFNNKMVPLNIQGIEEGTKLLSRLK